MEESINQDLPRNNNAENNSASNERSLPPASSENQSQTSSVREKTDPAWRYVALQNINGKPHYQCLFCLSTFGGGGINRMKKHLDQGGGGGSSSTFYAAPLAFSSPSSGNEGDDINDANLQQVMEDFDD